DTPTAAATQLFPFSAQQATPTITQSGGPSGTVYPGTAYTMTVTVSSHGTIQTGSVTFQLADAAGTPQVNLCVGNPLDAAGKASCSFNAPTTTRFPYTTLFRSDTPTAAATQLFPFSAQQATPTITQSGGPSGTVYPGTNY